MIHKFNVDIKIHSKRLLKLYLCNMSLLGNYTKLKVAQVTEHGAFLVAGNEQILLPKSTTTRQLSAGDEVDVFIYRDAEGRLIAIDSRPLVVVGECGFLTAKENTGFGTFMDWGISKDLLIPFSEQKNDLVEGRKYLVYVFIDERTNKVIGTTRVTDFVHNATVELSVGDEVDILVAGRSELGYNVVIENKHWGLIYHNEIFREIHEGDKMKGFVKLVRPDRKIDVSLQKQGYDEVSDASEKVIAELEKHKGFLPLHDKSEPDEIYRVLGISKKLFKKVIGLLYKQRRIEIGNDGIKVISS